MHTSHKTRQHSAPVDKVPLNRPQLFGIGIHLIDKWTFSGLLYLSFIEVYSSRGRILFFTIGQGMNYDGVHYSTVSAFADENILSGVRKNVVYLCFDTDWLKPKHLSLFWRNYYIDHKFRKLYYGLSMWHVKYHGLYHYTQLSCKWTRQIWWIW